MDEWYSTSGIGVANLGHCHPTVTSAAQKQCAEIVRLYYIIATVTA